MKICNCCGATENQINISTYKAIGILDNKLETVKLDICDCCSSWSDMKDDERICKLTGFDYVLSDYMTEDIITQIADYMVKTGTENTSTGNYFFYYDELAEIFGVYEDDIIHCADLIIDELKKHEEFCWDDQTIEKDCFSIIFFTNYCPNIEE